MAGAVDISGLDKVALLESLWDDAPCTGLFSKRFGRREEFDEARAKLVVKGFIRTFCGVKFMCDLSKDTADPSTYDRYAGQGAFAAVVAELRQSA
jgi:hypothetical protein